MRVVPLLFVLGSVAINPAIASDELTWTAAYRQRLEAVEQNNFDDKAFAHTARLRMGARLKLADAISAVVEGEGVWAINDRFNSGANGQTRYPTVADAEALEVNQAFLQWNGSAAALTLGRQRLTLDNQRFIGNVGWRQNEQTYDAALLAVDATEELNLQIGFIDRVHRFAGDRALNPLARERDLRTPLLHAAWRSPIGQFTGYFYGHEDRDQQSASTATVGLRWVGKFERGGWILAPTLEAARQQDYADNPQSFSHGYTLVEAAVTRNAFTTRFGVETLRGDGSHAFQTPLATLHAFNGWADVFTVTPIDGLEDRYLSLSVGWTPASSRAAQLALVGHDYVASRGDANYGREWDAVLSSELSRGWSITAKWANYQSDRFGSDVRKIWLQVEWKH